MTAALSIWEKESFYAPQDIIIAGAGLMGLWTALELKQKHPQRRITILERNTIPLGASTRNAGFACFGSPTELLHDAETQGIDNMLRIVEMRYKGIEKIRNYLKDEEIDFDPCGGYECINADYKHWGNLDDKILELNQALKQITGNTSIFERTTEKLTTLGLQGFDALVENRTEAALHSGKLVQALAQKLLASGVHILYGTGISGWHEAGNDIEVETNGQVMIKTKQLIYCTNAFTQTLLPETGITPARGQIIVTSPIEGLAMKGTFHYDEGFYYWRNLGNRILLGGARNEAFAEEETLNMDGSAIVRNALVAFLKKHLHSSYQYTIEHQWSGIMAFTENKQPMVKQLANNVFAAIACNGMGVALTPVIAEEMARMVSTNF
ncbi:MAG: FAD-dependent oxidoreductase [Bacteroidota bacterium]